MMVAAMMVVVMPMPPPPMMIIGTTRALTDEGSRPQERHRLNKVSGVANNADAANCGYPYRIGQFLRETLWKRIQHL
jgi:hypothetical protein